MDHAEALEQLELAALEPGGFDRLMAGDTPAAAAVAAHLAGCPSCAGELERLRRAAPLLRDVVRTTPPPDLRDRTLAFVREHGVARGVASGPAASAEWAAASAPGGGPAVVTSFPVADARPGRPSRVLLGSLAAIAAAVVISVVATTAWLGRDGGEYANQQRAVAGLEKVTVATLGITADPAAQRIALAPTSGAEAQGSLLYSPATTELVVVASGLKQPPAGQEYRCWLLVDGQRQDVGRMNFANELAYWVGWTPSVATVPPGTTFGVSLTDVAGSGPQVDPVLTGTL